MPETPIAGAFAAPASVPNVPTSVPPPVKSPLIALQYPGPYQIAESEAMAADAYMQNVIRMACPTPPAAPVPPRVQEMILREATAQLLHVPYAYGAPAWGQWALSESGILSLLWILMRLDRPQCTLDDAADILKSAPEPIANLVWERWGLNFTKKKEQRVASQQTGPG